MKVLIYCPYCKALWIAKGADAPRAWPRYGTGPFQKHFWADPVPVMVCPKHRIAPASEKRERAHV